MARALAIFVLVATLAVPVGAHAGPPFPIIVDQHAGPVVVSVWADPDIGVGTFYVTLDALPGGTVPDDLTVDVIVRPVSGRLPEATYRAERDRSQARVQYFAQAEFDRQEMWTIRIVVASSAGGGELAAEVEATPPGLGRWDILLYLMPFLAIGLLWVRALQRKRAIAREERRASPPPPA